MSTVEDRRRDAIDTMIAEEEYSVHETYHAAPEDGCEYCERAVREARRDALEPVRCEGCSWCEIGMHRECSACHCSWELDHQPANRVQECCEDAGCACHEEAAA